MSALGVSAASADLAVCCVAEGYGNRSGAALGRHDSGARDVGVASPGKGTSSRFAVGTIDGTRSESADGLGTDADLAKDGCVVERVGDVDDAAAHTGARAPPGLGVSALSGSGLQLGNVAHHLQRLRSLCQAEARLTPRDIWGKLRRPPSLAGPSRGGAVGASVLFSVATATEEIMRHGSGITTGEGREPVVAPSALVRKDTGTQGAG